MPSDQNRPGKPAWRKGSGGERPGASGPEWRRVQANDKAPAKGMSRSTKLALAAGGLLGLTAALFIIVLLIRPVRPTSFVLIGAGYDENLAVPHNAAGWNGLNELAALTRITSGNSPLWGATSKVHLFRDPIELKAGMAWDKDIEQIQERTILIYLALHGGSDEKGPYFLRQDADLNKKERLYFDDILDRLEKFQASAADKKKIILVVDPTQVLVNWSQGMLQNDFAREVTKREDRVQKIPNLVVLCASGTDQRSWVSPEWRTTIFTHYVIEGIKGAAAGSGMNRITALDLYNYVSKRVESWTESARADRQTPLLLGGEARAGEIEVTVADAYTRPEADSAPGAKEPYDLSLLMEAWTTRSQIAAQIPAPWVYTPLQWRRYQDILLRYEQLVRIGSREKQPALKRLLDQLADEMRRARTLELPSCAYNLVELPTVLGMGPAGTTADEAKILKDLWDAAPAEQFPRWEEMQKKAANRQLLQLKLTGLLVRRAADNPRQDLPKAVQLLELLGATNNRRAAEVHYMTMLQRDRHPEKSPPDSHLQAALRTRLLAEEVALAVDVGSPGVGSRPGFYPLGEIIAPWIRDKVNQADDKRRRGEDRLFATDPKQWDLARQELEQAHAGYRSAQADAEVVRSAVDVSQEAFALIPYYARWAGADLGGDGELAPTLEVVVDLARELHYLQRILDTPNPEAIERAVSLDSSESKPRNLKERIADIRGKLGDVQKRLSAYCAGLTNLPQATNVRRLEAVLLLPTLDPEQRRGFLQSVQTASRGLHVSTAEEKNQNLAAAVDPKKKEEQTRSYASRQGRLCLAVLGESFFDRAIKKPDPSFPGTKLLYYTPLENVLKNLPTYERWWERVGDAGEEVGLAWRQLANEVRDQTSQSRQVNLDTAATDLLQAERLARLAEGVVAQDSTRGNPAEENRRLRVHRLLLWLAERTRQDHWYGEVGQPAYYHAIGTSYVNEALSLLGGDGKDSQVQRERRAPAQKVADSLRQDEQLVFSLVEPRKLEATDESSLALVFRPEVKGWLPTGYPVVWLETSRFWKPSERERLVLKSEATEPVNFRIEPEPEKVASKVPKFDSAPVELKGVYRGQKILKEVPGRIHRTPDVTVIQQPLPTKAALAVRASDDIHEQFGQSKGSLAIVFDCSGSMSTGQQDPTKVPWPDEKTSRYHRATAAFQKVITNLPMGASVSLLMYGHKQGAVMKPANESIEWIRAPTPWNPGEGDSLMRRVVSAFPENYTPLIRAIWRAKNEGFPKEAKGFKTMLVLTDGGDSEFEKDAQLKGIAASIPEFIKKEFAESGIRIYIVAFDTKTLAAHEKLNLELIQKAVKELPLAGDLYFVEKQDELIQRLLRSLRQELNFRLRMGAAMVPGFADGVLIDKVNQQPTVHGLAPSDYTIRVETNKTIEQLLTLKAGDFLRVSLERDGGSGLRFGRVLYGEESENTNKQKQRSSDWLVTVSQNQFHEPTGSLDVLTTIESLKDRTVLLSDNPLQQARRLAQRSALATWLDVTPQGEDTARMAVRWEETYGYPAPAWRMKVEGWPLRTGTTEPARPRLDTYVNWDSPPTPIKTLRRDERPFRSAFRGEKALLNQDAAQEVLIESVDLEQRAVPSHFGAAPARVSCLVVRASFPAGQPIWAQLGGTAHVAEEHRFYTLAGKYVGIFGPLKEEDLRNLQSLQLYSVAAFKADKSNARHSLDLPTPSKNEPAPPDWARRNLEHESTP